jgi:hypothetical protein
MLFVAQTERLVFIGLPEVHPIVPPRGHPPLVIPQIPDFTLHSALPKRDALEVLYVESTILLRPPRGVITTSPHVHASVSCHAHIAQIVNSDVSYHIIRSDRGLISVSDLEGVG